MPRSLDFVFLSNITQLEHKGAQEALFWDFIQYYTTRAQGCPCGTFLGLYSILHNLSSRVPRRHYSWFISKITQLEHEGFQEAPFWVFYLEVHLEHRSTCHHYILQNRKTGISISYRINILYFIALDAVTKLTSYVKYLIYGYFCSLDLILGSKSWLCYL